MQIHKAHLMMIQEQMIRMMIPKTVNSLILTNSQMIAKMIMMKMTKINQMILSQIPIPLIQLTDNPSERPSKSSKQNTTVGIPHNYKLQSIPSSFQTIFESSETTAIIVALTL